ncbi:MAG: hypothetical protein KF726_23260 [Anaerolineae bacterium]|nr:hypothetical protein [Anaerolineae bacterium]
MKYARLLIITLTAILLVFPLPVHAADKSGLFTLFQSDPVISHSKHYRDWDDRYTDPGAVLYHDGMFHMFRNGFRNWPAEVQIGYLTSPDGLTWTEAQEEPVLTSAEVPYAGLAALASSALVEADGTWVLYFYTWEARNNNAGNKIGRATAASPLGPWKVDAEPVLVPDKAGSWDDLQVNAPRVLTTDDGYVMYFAGARKGDNSNLGSGIGMATSTDGIHWQKYNDPATTDVSFAESDPVLQSNDPTRFWHQPNVQHTPDGWVLVYRSASVTPLQGGPKMALEYAVSEDGIHFKSGSQNPLWRYDKIPNSNGFWYTALVYHDGTYYLYVEGGRFSVTDIYVGTFEGSLE